MYISGFNVKLTAPYGLMILRVVLGIAFLIHGWSKFSGGVNNVAGFFTSLNVPAPDFFAYVVSIVELVGGAFLIVGFLTQLSSILLFIDMLGAMIFNYWMQGAPFVGQSGGIPWEREAVFAAAAACLALAGPGIWSVDDIVVETRLGSRRARTAE